jgi:hypothetical protein
VECGSLLPLFFVATAAPQTRTAAASCRTPQAALSPVAKKPVPSCSIGTGPLRRNEIDGVVMVTWSLRICALLFSFVMFVSAWDGWQSNQAFAARGQKALIEPLGEYTETTTTKKKLFVKVSESKSHSAELTFTTQTGQRVTVNRNLSDDILGRFLEGEDVYMEYLPEDPRTTRFAGDTSSPFKTALFGLFVLAATILFWKKF